MQTHVDTPGCNRLHALTPQDYFFPKFPLTKNVFKRSIRRPQQGLQLLQEGIGVSFIALNAIVLWVLFSMGRYSLDTCGDMTEAYSWGISWQWWYDKHAPSPPGLLAKLGIGW